MSAPNPHSREYDFGFQEGISCIRTGSFLKKNETSVAIANQGGKVKIISYSNSSKEWVVQREFDLDANGGIWNMEVADLDCDGRDELIIGGMNGAVICLSGEGEELWMTQCESAISGIVLFPNFSALSTKTTTAAEDAVDLCSNAPHVLIYSLDRTLRLLSPQGDMVWAQMFASGVGCVTLGDTNGDGLEEVVAGGNDGTLRIFDGRNGKILWFHEVNANVRAVAVIGQLIYCGGDSKKVLLLDGKTQKPILDQDYPTYVWLMKPKSLNGLDYLIMSTYSFRYLGMDDAPGEPSLGAYHPVSLIPKWVSDKINVQDFCSGSVLVDNVPIPYLLLGESSGMFSLVNGETGAPMGRDSFEILPDLINSVASIAVQTAEEKPTLRCFAGCENGKVYVKEIVLTE